MVSMFPSLFQDARKNWKARLRVSKALTENSKVV